MRTVLHICGVGGQSIPLIVAMLSRRIDRSATRLSVRQSFGMSQQFGIVRACLNFENSEDDNKVKTILAGLEILEGLRGLSFLRPGDSAYVCTDAIVPPGTFKQSWPPYPSLEDLKWCAEELGIGLCCVDTKASAPWGVIQKLIDDNMLPVNRMKRG